VEIPWASGKVTKKMPEVEPGDHQPPDVPGYPGDAPHPRPRNMAANAASPLAGRQNHLLAEAAVWAVARGRNGEGFDEAVIC